jgi:hypothetical protein
MRALHEKLIGVHHEKLIIEHHRRLATTHDCSGVDSAA